MLTTDHMGTKAPYSYEDYLRDKAKGVDPDAMSPLAVIIVVGLMAAAIAVILFI